MTALNRGLVEDNLLSLSYGEIKRKDIEANFGLLPESFETYQVVQAGDMVFRFTDLQNDQKSLRSGLVKERGIITNAYVGFRPTEIDSRYFNYLMRAYDLAGVFYSMGSGLRQSLNYSDVRRLPVVVPPGDEQRRIADYLDRELAEIDALSSKLTVLLELASKMRMAAITGYCLGGGARAGTHTGTHDLPEGWKWVPLKHLGLTNPESLAENNDSDFDINYVEISNVSFEKGIESFQNLNFANAPSRARRKVRHGDILISTVRTYLRAIGISSHPYPEELVASTGFCVLRPLRILPEFLRFALLAEPIVGEIEARSVGISYPSIRTDDLVSIKVPVPPASVQEEIVSNLKKLLGRLDGISEAVMRQLNLLSERSATLVSEVALGRERL